jgi:diguanylate cyclase (GGDEF)-like protein/PAS domain S-box-containing protein
MRETPPASTPAPPTDTSPERRARRRRWREQALVLAPALAFGLVILTIWAFVAWFVVERPKALRDEQRREMMAAVRTAAMQTESVLRQAESALRVVDLWVLRHPPGSPQDEAALAQLADSIRNSSSKMVDVVLVARTGRVQRLQPLRGDAPASIAGSAAFDQVSGLVVEGTTVGAPLRLGELADDGRWQLPLLMRLSRPMGEVDTVMALIDLQRLRDVQSLFMPGTDSAIVMLRSDGLTLSRYPELPGFVGRNLFALYPDRRQAFNDIEGLFTSTGAASDGQARTGAYVSLGDFGIKLLLSGTDEAALSSHRQQRNLLLALALVATLAIAAFARWLGLLQRASRLRDAALQATSNAMPLGLFRTDNTGRIVYVNDSYLRVHGMRREDIEWGWTQLVLPEQRDMLIRLWKHHMATGEPIDMVRKMKRGDDGRVRLIAVRTAPLIIDGQVNGQSGTVEDVTERGEQEKARQTLAAIFDMTPDIVCQARENGDLVYLNPTARAHIGMAADAPLDGAHISAFFTPEQLDLYQREVLPIAMRDGHWRGRGSVRVGGQSLPVDCTVLVHRDMRGRIETISVILRDVSEQVRARRERERSEAMLLAVAHTARAQIVVADTARQVIFLNEAFEEARGVRREDWVGRPLAELLGETDYAAREPLISAALAGENQRAELQADGRDGQIIDGQFAPLRVQSGKIEGVICLELDVTQARREEARLRLASQTDALTQLLNRAGFEQGCLRLLQQARDQPGQFIALLYLDLDKFKPVNDTHGHPTGDALLKAVALRLRHVLRPADLLARLGGDEFAVMLPALAHAEDAAAVAEKLVRVIDKRFHFGDLELEIGVSVGYCVVAEGRAELAELVQQADAQLYEAKRAGRGRWRGGPLQGLQAAPPLTPLKPPPRS